MKLNANKTFSPIQIDFLNQLQSAKGYSLAPPWTVNILHGGIISVLHLKSPSWV